MSVYKKISERLLTTRNLTIGYYEKSILKYLFEDLNLELFAGELVCFMGSNGIGKSTLIRTLAGLQKPLKGDVVYNNSNDLSKKIAVVLTDRISASHITGYELITFGRYPYLDWTIKLNETDKRIIEDSIASVNVGHLLDKKLYELSDGQLQMVMIARALAQDGEIILLDEPTAHLDLNNRVEVMNLLRKLSRITHKAILVATHELDLALQTADSIWLAGRDKNILTGIPEDLVLNGSFDEVFQFKGFDLKTGKIQHESFRNMSINLTGSGHEYLWTKNALERNGFDINSDAPISITILKKEGKTNWLLTKDEKSISVVSLSSLIESLV